MTGRVISESKRKEVAAYFRFNLSLNKLHNSCAFMPVPVVEIFSCAFTSRLFSLRMLRSRALASSIF